MGDIKYSLLGKTYVYDNDDLDLLDGYEPQKGDWKDGAFDDFKKNIKTLYYNDQNERCAFCRKIINFEGYTEPLEHILYKDRYPQWMFHPKNLVVSCDPCNGKKSKFNSLVNGCSLNVFPIQPQYFVTLNPHLEDWNHHLKLKKGLFFIAKTVKGLKTIEVYKLTRSDVIHHHSKFKRINKESLAKKAAKLAYEVNPNSNNYMTIMNSIDAIIG
ncbi:hypothetical protein [uncultured Psychroserpens sp.]|uniref:HNH endonuclease n=1 Tax=uncultured Psychroserpens sp. TaxID=255436 RepID=UPI002612B17D|nr:hypothetical protein [uncultured Psychroserpens sp.]